MGPLNHRILDYLPFDGQLFTLGMSDELVGFTDVRLYHLMRGYVYKWLDSETCRGLSGNNQSHWKNVRSLAGCKGLL